MFDYSKMRKFLLNLNQLPIYIAGHVKPDQDSVCSCLALAQWLNKNNKNAKVLLKKDDYSIIDWQGGSDLIVDKLTENKYNFIALDVNEMKRLGEFYEYFKTAETTINIDHHQGNDYEADVVLSQSDMSSTCEIIYKIIKPSKKEEFDLTFYEQLYCGMMNDTNCFSRRLSKTTLSIAQKLIDSGINYAKIIKKTFASRTLYQYKAMAKMINELTFDSFHYVVVDKSLPEYCKLSHNEIVKQIAEDLRKIDGIDLFVVLIKENDAIIGKVMTNETENANKIAEVLGGGGHKKEAGFTIKNISVEEVVLKIKNYIKR